MKKIFILFIILFTFSLFIKLPKYKELNHLKIIDKITIKCDYYVLREIIPIKDDGGIEYDYKYYKVKKINKNNFYIDKSKIIKDCNKKD